MVLLWLTVEQWKAFPKASEKAPCFLTWLCFVESAQMSFETCVELVEHGAPLPIRKRVGTEAAGWGAKGTWTHALQPPRLPAPLDGSVPNPSRAKRPRENRS